MTLAVLSSFAPQFMWTPPRWLVSATQLGYPCSQEQVHRRLLPISGNPDHIVRVAVKDGRPVGWVHSFICRLVESDPYAEIGGLVVDESCRGEGAGRLLLQQVEQWAREKGCRAVSLRCNILREKAHGFYEALGYGRIKTQHNFRKEL